VDEYHQRNVKRCCTCGIEEEEEVLRLRLLQRRRMRCCGCN
jgi:hypothetical protein